MAAIRTENLGKTYGGKRATTAVRGLNLEVKEGEIFGFLGPNGAGKTTTIHLLLNILQPSTGTAFLFDTPVSDADIRRRLGYLPESVTLHDYYTGEDLLIFYGRLLGFDRPTAVKRARETLVTVKLEQAARQTVAKYSKGMLQRLGFAQAMLHDPDLLILDEPTASLDPVARKEFRDIILALKQRGKTVFISSHILSEIESLCDRVAILQGGELKRIGSLSELSAAKSCRLVIRVPAPDVFQALAATGAPITIVQTLATIRCADDTIRQTVEAILAQHNIPIEQREAETQPLEEIFFSTIAPAPPPII